jgi:hypothetical protein
MDIYVENGKLDYYSSSVIGGVNYTYYPVSDINQRYEGLGAAWHHFYYESQKANIARITFTPTVTRKYTIDEIFANSVVKFVSNVTASTYITEDSDTHKITQSFDIFSKEVDENGYSKWKIKSKWEFPYLVMTNSFVAFSSSFGEKDAGFTGEDKSSLSLRPKINKYYLGGLWHDFCETPSEQQGIFLNISDYNYKIGSFVVQSSSLANAVGFKKETKRIGELNEQKEISELICIVPVNKNNNSFIKIDQTFDLYQENQKYLKKYILPPKLDYLLDGIDPVMMFCKEITDIWSKRDLSYIWQNLLPQNGLNHKHKSEKYEVADQKAIELLKNKEIYFMIFKCKLRSVTNPHGTYGYNWPYDECSLIELAQIEAITEEQK